MHDNARLYPSGLSTRLVVYLLWYIHAQSTTLVYPMTTLLKVRQPSVDAPYGDGGGEGGVARGGASTGWPPELDCGGCARFFGDLGERPPLRDVGDGALRALLGVGSGLTAGGTGSGRPW